MRQVYMQYKFGYTAFAYENLAAVGVVQSTQNLS